jgi:hypothetical protein
VATSAEAFLRHASAVLSVALQCGNADIAAKGVQSLRLQQAATAAAPIASAAGGTSRRASRRPSDAGSCGDGKLHVDGFHTLYHAASAHGRSRHAQMLPFSSAA